MLINRLILKNFKCFRQADVTFSKITLLTGENSSGKTSLLYGILAPLQSKGFPLYLSPNGQYVNMGDFEEMSFNHLKDNEIEIEIFTRHVYDIYKKIQFNTTWVIDNVSNGLPVLNSLKIIANSLKVSTTKKGVAWSFQLGEQPEKLITSQEELEKELNSLNVSQVAFESFRRQASDYFFNFVSSFRLPPQRTYYQQTKVDKVGSEGQNYLDQILTWETTHSPELKELTKILKDLKLLYSLKVQRFKGGRFEPRVKVKSKGKWASLTDVGFGISQFLPIIVADLQMSKPSCLLLAQPEIHLHPSVQASLADYFVQQVSHAYNQYIIETHSEYLLNRMRLHIVTGKLQPADVAVYYFENSVTTGTLIYPIEFTTDGQIKGAPPGFFDTYMMDVMDIAIHA